MFKEIKQGVLYFSNTSPSVMMPINVNYSLNVNIMIFINAISHTVIATLYCNDEGQLKNNL